MTEKQKKAYAGTEIAGKKLAVHLAPNALHGVSTDFGGLPTVSAISLHERPSK